MDLKIALAAVGAVLAGLLLWGAIRSGRQPNPTASPALRLPRNYSETNQCFAWVIVDSPAFTQDGFTLDEAFQHLYHGLRLLSAKLRSDQTKDLHALCLRQVDHALESFKSNDIKAGKHGLQDAWETFKAIKKAGVRSHYWDEERA